MAQTTSEIELIEERYYQRLEMMRIAYQKELDKINTEVAEELILLEKQLAEDLKDKTRHYQDQYVVIHKHLQELDLIPSYWRQSEADWEVFRSLTADDEIVVKVADYIRKGRDFEKLMEAIESNEVTKSTWNRFLVSLKMVQE